LTSTNLALTPAAPDLDATVTRRALLLIDVAGSLRITRQLGDLEAYRVLKYLTATLQNSPTMSGGRLVRSLGDGFLLAFDTVDGAVAHAIAAQRGVEELNPTTCTIKIRCAVHHGDVLEADGDMFGVSIYLAARVAGHAHGGEILLTDEALRATGDHGLPVNSFGPTLLPGFEEPVCLYELPWRDLGL
jgi:class 3 adenylate cyclase